MAHYHGSIDSQTPATRRMGVMGEERDPDHVVRQGNPGQPPASSSPSFFFAGTTTTARSSSPTHTNPNSLPIFTTPTYPRRPASSSGLIQNSSNASVQQRRSTEHLGARSEFVHPQDLQRPDCPDGGDLQSRIPDFRQGFRYECVLPGSDLRKGGVLLPPRSPQRSSALPLRSPKRTISFDFPENMDPRRVEQIHRKIVQMAQEAGASDSVKIVEEPPENEPTPIFQLQDPPKPKFKRQLSADNSPPDKSSSATAVPDGAAGRQHVQPGTVASTMSPRASASHQSGTLTVPGHADGSSYTSSAMSPKRLKSEHGALSCTPPKSPLVKQLVTQVAETTLNRRGGGVESKHADVVHVLLGGGVNDSNNNNKSADRQTRDSDSVPDFRQADEPDSRLKKAESKTSACDVVSVLNSQQPKKSPKKDKTVPPFVSDSATPRRPEEHMQTLHMLFKVTGDNPDSKRQRQSSAKNTSDFDQDSVSESDSLVQKQSVDSSSENRSQKTDRAEKQTAGKDGVPLQKQTTVSTPSQPRPVPSTAMKTTKKSEDMVVDSDLYMAGLEGRLKDMQRHIFAYDLAYTGQTMTQKKDKDEESTGTENLNRESTKETFTSQRTSSSSSTTTTLAASRGLSSEEQSRTARLCGSKTNPFTFSSTDIEKAKTVLSTHDPLRHTPSPPPHNQERTEDVSGRASSEEAHGAGQFRLGELWISKSRENQTSAVMAHRQLSDPGTMHPASKLNPVLEKVKATPLRQFSEPARPQDNLSNNEPNEFQKCQEPERSLQQHGAFRSKNCDCFAGSEGRSSFFPREGEERTNDTMYGSCSTSQDQFIYQNFPECGGQSNFTARRRQILDNSFPSETNVSREYKDPYCLMYKQTHIRHHPGEQAATSSHWIPPPRPQGHRKDRASASSRQVLEDDSVFEEGSGTDRGSPFKNPALPFLLDHFLERSADRLSSGRLSSDRSPKRPALRSQSNVEQSPNKAELEAMAHFKYLRSFSEHISDPKRLMEQLQALRPADYDQFMEQLYDLPGGGGAGLSCSSFGSEKDSDRSQSSWTGRGTGVRRTLFQEANAEMPSGGQYELAEWQQQGSYTYPPPLARRQTCSPARDLRRCLSWFRDMERSGHMSDMTRSRQPGDLDVTLECTQATPAHHQYYDTSRTPTTPPHHHHPDALCKKVEAYIQQILQRQLQTRPSGSSQAEMNVWIAQTNDIERLTQEASQMISSLSEHHRTVYDVLTGSVVIKVNCSTLSGVHDLWQKFESGLLQRMVDELVGGERFRALAGAVEVEVKVTLCPFQYAMCLEELESSLAAQTPVRSPVSLESESTASSVGKVCTEKAEKKLQDSRHPVSPLSSTPNDVSLLETLELMMSPALLSPSPTRSPSTPSKRHGKFVFGDCSARKAFSELNLSDGELTPTSPSKKFFDPLQKENSMLSPLVSPRIVPSPTGRSRLSLSDVMDENYELLKDQT